MKIIDFTNCPLSDRNLEYGGRAGEKRGIVFDGGYWFLKFPKNTRGMDGVKGLSYVTSPLNEFIGCQIYKILGYEVQDTILGFFNNGKRIKAVCACKDFIANEREEVLLPYTALRNDTNEVIMERNDTSSMEPSNIYEIYFQLEHNSILSKIDNAESRFFEGLIIDMLINNNDRNEDNWGVIKNRRTLSYRLAPIYDCGNCFYGKSGEEKIEGILSDEDRLRSSALQCVTAYQDNEGNTLTASKIIELDFLPLEEAIKKIYLNVMEHLNEIHDFLFDIPTCFDDELLMSEARKEYYFKTFKLRLTDLLEKRYRELLGTENR